MAEYTGWLVRGDRKDRLRPTRFVIPPSVSSKIFVEFGSRQSKFLRSWRLLIASSRQAIGALTLLRDALRRRLAPRLASEASPRIQARFRSRSEEMIRQERRTAPRATGSAFLMTKRGASISARTMRHKFEAHHYFALSRKQIATLLLCGAEPVWWKTNSIGI